MNHETKLMFAALWVSKIYRALADWLASKLDCLAPAMSMLVGSASQKRALGVNETNTCCFFPEDDEVDLSTLNRLLVMQSTPDFDRMGAVCIVSVHPNDIGADAKRILAASQVREVA